MGERRYRNLSLPEFFEENGNVVDKKLRFRVLTGFIKLISGREDLDRKIYTAIKEIQTHKGHLDNTRGNLEERRQKLFDYVISAAEQLDQRRAKVFSDEHSEVMRLIDIQSTGDLALTQMLVRLESMKDMEDLVVHLSSSFEVVKGISGDVSNVISALQETQDMMMSSLNESLVRLGVNPSEADFDSEKIVERARELARRSLTSNEENNPIDLLTKEAMDLKLSLKHLEAPLVNEKELFNMILDHVRSHNNEVDVKKIAKELAVPEDQVENATIKLALKGRLRQPQIIER
ncbi:MAG: hypothetical protein O7B32_02815 [Thaumarchaeota archaeon]|nr:hypothetical protein [Nitrososphaerota archaeon]